MKRTIVVLVLFAMLAGVVPQKAEARVGNGKLALIAGATVAAGVAAIMAAKNEIDRQLEWSSSEKKYLYLYGWHWKARQVAAASIGAGVLVGGLFYVGLSVKGGKSVTVRFPLGK